MRRKTAFTGLSEGRRLLLHVLATNTQATVAKRVGCGRSTISMFASGHKTPQLWSERVAFEREFAIRGASWDEPAACVLSRE